MLWFVFPSIAGVRPIQVWWLIKCSELRQSLCKANSHNKTQRAGERKRQGQTSWIFKRTTQRVPGWHMVWNFRVTYHKSYLTTEHLASHFTILCNQKTYAQAGYTSVMLKGCTDEIMAAVLSDQTREWLYHPHYNSSDLTPAPGIHAFSHIQLSYFCFV